MACHHPRKAWRSKGGSVLLREPLDTDGLGFFRIACGVCLGCRMARARDWAIRCRLELTQHNTAAFATLTYSDKYVPPTLSKNHLAGFVKRLRARLSEDDKKIRFFACGEYGDNATKRPHYHAILFGPVQPRDIEATWQKGHIRVDPVTPASINYVAGYTTKKNRFYRDKAERVDQETGEVFIYQPPFLQMSRNPGIGSHARQHWQSWREFAIQDGYKIPVPRYLHEAWKKHASPEALASLEEKREAALLENYGTLEALDETDRRLAAVAAIDQAKHNRQTETRKL